VPGGGAVHSIITRREQVQVAQRRHAQLTRSPHRRGQTGLEEFLFLVPWRS
jgi:hypothetical protein